MYDLNLFKTRLKDKMTELNINSVELAKKCNGVISKQDICWYLKGDYYPQAKKVIVLATALNCSIDWLYGKSAK